MATSDKDKDMKVEVTTDDENTPEEGSADTAEPQGSDVTELDEEAMVEAARAAGEAAAEQEIEADIDAVRAERDKFAAQLAESQDNEAAANARASEATDRLARLQADWENFRRRTASERLAERERATEKLVENLLPVIDDLERAIAHARGTEGDATLAQFAEGVEAVHTKLVGVLAKEGAEVIDPAGEPFDPLSHQAVGRVEDTDAYEETVADVYQKGYRMGGKVLRAAMVTVTYGGPSRPAEEPEPEPEAEADQDADGDDSKANEQE